MIHGPGSRGHSLGQIEARRPYICEAPLTSQFKIKVFRRLVARLERLCFPLHGSA